MSGTAPAAEETRPADQAAITTYQRMQMIPVQEILARRSAVSQLVAAAFKEDTHFGTIPGCGDRRVILKPGVDLAAMAFHLGDKYEFKVSDLPGGHREYETRCILFYIPTGTVIAEGIAICSSMESKYRYRGTQVESTGEVVPKAYWDARNAGDHAQANKLLGGPQFVAKKIDGQWMKCSKTAEKMENADPADTFNTVKKMAAKRAKAAAVISALAIADQFDHDIGEELFDEGIAADAKPVESKPATAGAAKGKAADKPADAKPAQKAPTKEQTPGKVVETIRAIPGCDTVTLDDLEEYAQRTCKLDSCAVWNEDAYAAFRNIVAELRSKSAAPADFFPRLKGDSN